MKFAAVVDQGTDCLDMVIGVMINGMSQIRDYYSFPQMKPQPDEFFGGQDSLTSAVAYQQDGITTLIFRKPLMGMEQSVIGKQFGNQKFSSIC